MNISENQMKWEDYLQVATAINAKTIEDQVQIFAKVNSKKNEILLNVAYRQKWRRPFGME